MSLFVTDGEERATLAVVRALGAAGIPVTVGSSQPHCLAGSSRYCAKRVCYPPSEHSEDFCAFLLEEIHRGKYDVFLPMTDLTMQLVSSVRGAIPAGVGLPFPGKEQVTRVQDKREMVALAGKVGIACPKTITLSDPREVEEVSKKLRYPVVIKPRFSRYFAGGRVVTGSVQYANDAATLISHYRHLNDLIPLPLIQERIEGEGRGIFLLIWNGELRAAFSHRRLREKPPWGGVSVYSESVPLDQELVNKSDALLKAAGWQGVAMVEFKVDRRDGRAKLMEVNGRFWGSLQLAIDAGMNFPLMLYRLALGENLPPTFDYRVGVRSRWLLGDLDHLLIRLTYSGPMNGSLRRQGSRTRAILNFMKLYERNTRYDVFRLNDPAPGWFELRKYFRDMFCPPKTAPKVARAH
jgi:predicted ATP-grasp superfamily ATP-dependent carboligase